MRILALIATLLFVTAPALAGPQVRTTWRYERATPSAIERGSRSVEIPAAEGHTLVSTDQGIEKTIFLVEVVKGVSTALERYEKACPATFEPERSVEERPCTEARKAIARQLREDIAGWSERLYASAMLRADTQVAETMDVLRKLSASMAEAKEPVGGFEVSRPLYAMAPMAGGAPAAGPGLSVTGGGAQGYGYFRKLVMDGQVPKADILTVEGFLREFDLSLVGGRCEMLVCVEPAVAVDPDKKRMYVQIGMSSSVTREAFHRRPLNLSVVLDISGSMSATDETEKSRIEWAKDALIETINELDEEKDLISIVVFNTTSKVLIRPTRAQDKARLIEQVKGLEAGGSTNLEAGLRDGFEEVSENRDRLEGYEHRVILISDAGLNTGVTEESALLKLVTDYASEGIGLTALGLGENFNQDFIHAIANSRGGNYMFVHSGQDMMRYFAAFDYLVTPVAYDFKARLDFVGLTPKLVAAYGVATENGAQPAREIIDLETLFFSEAGGAILLEYELSSARGRE